LSYAGGCDSHGKRTQFPSFAVLGSHRCDDHPSDNHPSDDQQAAGHAANLGG